MAIAYPRELPSTRIKAVRFEAEPQEAFAPEQGGRFVGVALGPALWEARYATTPPNEVEFSKWRAWLDSLDGAAQPFFGYDARRPLPWNYRSGFAGLLRAVSGAAFDGTTTSWSVNMARDAVTLGAAASQELPVGFRLIEGDYIGLRWTVSGASRRSLHRVLEDNAANASGVGTWAIRPHVHPSVPADAVANMNKANCLMRVTTRDREAEHKSRNIAFEARQSLEF